MVGDEDKRPKFCINDHVDIMLEILKRLDGRSLGAAACVCRLWRSVARNDWVWEHLCFRHVSPPPEPGVRLVVEAMGGYQRLYMVCLRPVLSRLARMKRLGLGGDGEEVARQVMSRHEVELSLSLFSVAYYERLGGGGRLNDEAASSLMFLCKPLTVGLNDLSPVD
ncbi:hypothetical protein U1Q18_044308 [Sarracenia purpurea var. burkii]